ncbi:SufD family Fe-S cluster assembly protein [Candidatus Saccharibacteria bacterium]|nr:SufD family Fe-S cluster assembly protein [Candidatus Saccharibacteria bacterium]
MDLSEIEWKALNTVADLYEIPEGAYNFRINGKVAGRNSTAAIDVSSKSNGKGLEIRIKPGTKNQSVHIPVIISHSGLSEVVENDFYVGEGADVVIIAGCGIYNCGGQDSIHNGVHRLFVEKNARVVYQEKHYGFGQGGGAKILNPTTSVFQEAGSEVVMELEQLKGVTSTNRVTKASLEERAKLIVREKLLTHGKQFANSEIEARLVGENSSVDIVSRAVAQDYSEQKFCSRIIGEAACHGHSECDAIIMNQAKVIAVPSLEAKSVEAELIHEAAIGKIAGEQLMKLMTLGLTRAEAESQIVNGFLQ